MQRHLEADICRALALALALALAACGDEEGVPDDAVAPAAVDGSSDVAGDGLPGDVASAPDAESDDAHGRDASDSPPRRWTWRAIGGISMGAAAVNIATRHPDAFDLVGALGGYIDVPYMVQTGVRLQLAGFCSLADLEARTEALNDPAAEPPIFCGPARADYELEAPQDFNHLRYDTNGASFDREFYMQVFQSLTMAFGNFTAEPTGESPYLPGGLDEAWHGETEPAARCAAPRAVARGASFNAEYNPVGAHPVIPLCDSDAQGEGGWAPASYDPRADHRRPTDILLSVDINRNGRRDWGEPLFLNPFERFEDVGADGCADPREDGAGGCLSEGAPDAEGDDPNGDDYHWWDNPRGGEGDRARGEGEPFDDLGLDGVGAAVAGSADLGEGNGVHDRVSAFARADAIDARAGILRLDDDQIARLDFYFDAGIRDPLHAAVATRRVVGALRSRDPDVTHFRGLQGRPGSLLPDATEGQVLQRVFDMPITAAEIGRHVYVEYGDPAAGPERLAAGDGGHVGTTMQAMNRLVVFLAWAMRRMPDPDTDPAEAPPAGYTEVAHYWSDALQSRRAYTVVLPPGYPDADRATRRYPAVFFLHGLGQQASDLAPAAIITSALMKDGRLPKVILVFVDGACCDRHQPSGRRECACRPSRTDGMRICVDPACQASGDGCEEREIPSRELVEECNGGSLYYLSLIHI